MTFPDTDKINHAKNKTSSTNTKGISLNVEWMPEYPCERLHLKQRGEKPNMCFCTVISRTAAIDRPYTQGSYKTNTAVRCYICHLEETVGCNAR